MLLKEQSKVKRKKKRRKKVLRGRQDQRPVEGSVKIVKQFKTGRRALRKKKRKFDV